MRTLKPLNINDKEQDRLLSIIENNIYDLSITTPCKIIYYYVYNFHIFNMCHNKNLHNHGSYNKPYLLYHLVLLIKVSD